MPLPFKLVSADSHIVEPVGLWAERIDRRYLDRAPRIVSYDDSDWFFIDDSASRSTPPGAASGSV